MDRSASADNAQLLTIVVAWLEAGVAPTPLGKWRKALSLVRCILPLGVLPYEEGLINLLGVLKP